MDTTNETPETDPPNLLRSYDGLLNQEYGAEAVARNRAALQTATGLGSPRTALRIGAMAPAFALADTAGTMVSLASLLAEGPVVVIFYRGGWCPFCNVHLRAFQLARSRIRTLGASVVLISPQRAEYAQALVETHTLLFPLLSDVGNQVARQYGLVFQMPAELREGYRADGINLAEINGDASWEIPMPATFVIDRSGITQYAFVSADYTQRADPSDVLAVLRRLVSRR